MGRRRLADLFVVGREVVFDDGNGEAVKVWLQKISPLDHQNALRRANQARARVLARQLSDGSEWDISVAEATEMKREDKVNYLVMDEITGRIPAWEAELGSEEEWSKDGYLDGLKDSWEDGLSRRYQEDPTDEEAVHVFAEITRYTQIVEQRIDDEKEALTRDYEQRTDEEITHKVAEKLNQSKGDIAWLNEFRRCEIWLAVRDPRDHNKRYLESREELDMCSQEVLLRLLDEYREMSVDVTEGKDLPEPDNSSDSSESLENPEPAQASGLQAATA
jgi:hypothetical protein